MERPHAFCFTGNSGIQVRAVGFGPIDYLTLLINQDLIYYFVTETNRFGEQFLSGTDVYKFSPSYDAIYMSNYVNLGKISFIRKNLFHFCNLFFPQFFSLPMSLALFARSPYIYLFFF